MSEKNQGEESNSSNGHFSMAKSTMIEQPFVDVNKGPNTFPNEFRSADVSNEEDSSSDHEQFTPTSRIGCFRRSVSSLGLSDQTQELMLKTWGKGTNSSYDPAWKKWSGWCLGQSFDTFSAHLNAVLEFLSWMFYEDFQYGTINVYRSAISSILLHIKRASRTESFHYDINEKYS